MLVVLIHAVVLEAHDASVGLVGIFLGVAAGGYLSLKLGLMRAVLGAQEAAAVVGWTVAILVSYGGAGLAATVQAVIFRRLLEWREGGALPARSPS